MRFDRNAQAQAQAQGREDMYTSQNKSEPSLRGDTGYSFTFGQNGPLDGFAPIEFLVEVDEHEAEDCGRYDGYG